MLPSKWPKRETEAAKLKEINELVKHFWTTSVATTVDIDYTSDHNCLQIN